MEGIENENFSNTGAAKMGIFICLWFLYNIYLLIENTKRATCHSEPAGSVVFFFYHAYIIKAYKSSIAGTYAYTLVD